MVSKDAGVRDCLVVRIRLGLEFSSVKSLLRLNNTLMLYSRFLANGVVACGRT